MFRDKWNNSIQRVMIDAEDSFMSLFRDVGQEFIICKFHFIRSIKKHLPKEKKEEILKVIYSMCNCRDEEQFDYYKNQFENMQNIDKFRHYFYKYWWSLRNNWSNVFKTTTFALLNTYNYVEANIKSLKNTIHTDSMKKKKLSDVMLKILFYINNQKQHYRPPITKTRRQANARLQEARKHLMYINTYEIDSNSSEWIVDSFDELNEEKYHVHISKSGITCDCGDFGYYGRPCKHLYLIMMKFYTGCDAFDLIKDCCIQLNINVNLNKNSTILHFLPDTIVQPNFTEKFPIKYRRNKKRKRNDETAEIMLECNSSSSSDDDSK